MATKPRHLTDKEAAFVSEYLVDKNATQAAIRAGYSARSAKQRGYLLLQRPEIRAAIDKGLEAQKRKALTTNTNNLKRIDRIAERAEHLGELAISLRASELLGKHFGSFPNKVELTGKDGTPLEHLSDEQIDARIRALMHAKG